MSWLHHPVIVYLNKITAALTVSIIENPTLIKLPYSQSAFNIRITQSEVSFNLSTDDHLGHLLIVIFLSFFGHPEYRKSSFLVTL